MLCGVTFRVTAPLAAGERVHVMGDVPGLGAWHVSGSLPLTTTTDAYPIWFTSRPIQLPSDTPLRYKYCVVADGRLVRSEAIEGTRLLTPHGREVMVEDRMDVQPAYQHAQPHPASAAHHHHSHHSHHSHGGEAGGVHRRHSAAHAELVEMADDQMFGALMGATATAAAGASAAAAGGPAKPTPARPLVASALPTASASAFGVSASAVDSESGRVHPRTVPLPAQAGEVGAAAAGQPPGASASQHAHARSAGDAPDAASSPRRSGGGLGAAPSSSSAAGNGVAGPLPSSSAPSSTNGGAAAGGSTAETLTDSDGVLVVQYRLPVKMRKVMHPATSASVAAFEGIGGGGSGSAPATPLAGPSATTAAAGGDGASLPPSASVSSSLGGGRRAPGGASSSSSAAGSTAGGGTYSWEVSWDEEALLSPKQHQQHGAHPRGASAVRAAASSIASTGGIGSVRIKWIGTPPVHVEPHDEDAVTRALEAFSCIPVFLPARVESAYYDGYCRDTLWPIFHNVIDVYGELPTRWWMRERQADRWKSYCDGNQRFAAAVVENFHEGDLVWIHDYHLLLVPMILARRHIAPIAVFLHIPFPSSEVFRTLSVRDELLRGMLAADSIGFHLFEYARHFLTSCRRILGLTHSAKRGGILAVDYQGREVQVSISHVGIEPDFLRAQFSASVALGAAGEGEEEAGDFHPAASAQLTALADGDGASASALAALATSSSSLPPVSHSIVAAAAAWRAQFPGCALIAGLDSIERLRGVPLKLAAYESFLAAHPHWAGRVTLVQVCTQEVVRPGDTQETSLSEIATLAARINAAFSVPGAPPAVHLVLTRYLPLRHRLALWAASDVYLNTAIRDGLNLTPFEYAYARGSGACIPAGLEAAATAGAAGALSPELEALRSLPCGALILSEFSGASRVLAGALRVNPFRQEEVVSALAHALHMSPDEQASRGAANLQYVVGNTTTAWAGRVLLDLKRVSARATSRTYMGYGLGLGYRLMGFGSSFRPLNTEHVVTAYRKAGHRLIVVDYGGTLNTRENSLIKRHAFEMGLLGKDAAPPLTSEVRRALKVLSEDRRNTVFVISGKEREVLQAAFAGLPHVGLSAEHGAYYRWGAPVTSSSAGGAGGAAGGLERGRKGSVSRGALLSGGGDGGASEAGTASNRGSQGSLAAAAAANGASTPKLGAAPAPSSSAAVGDNGMPWEALWGGGPGSAGDWKGLGLGIMETYAARTNGTYILRKGSAISWHFGDADPEFGGMQAKELQDHLAGVLAGYPVDVLGGHDYVEVRPKGVNKGVVLALIMDYLEGRDRGGAQGAGDAGAGTGGQGPSQGAGGASSSASGAAQGNGANNGAGAAAGTSHASSGRDQEETAASSAAASKRPVPGVGGGLGLRMTPRYPVTPAPPPGDAPPPLALAAPAAAGGAAPGAAAVVGGGLHHAQGSSFDIASSAAAAAAAATAAATSGGGLPPLRIPPSAAGAGSSSSSSESAAPQPRPQVAGSGAALGAHHHSPSSATAAAALPPPFTPRPLEFILCIGDDAADEEMFGTVQAYRKERIAERRALVARFTAAQAAAAAAAASAAPTPAYGGGAPTLASSGFTLAAEAAAEAAAGGGPNSVTIGGGKPPSAPSRRGSIAGADGKDSDAGNAGFYYDGGVGASPAVGGGGDDALSSPGAPTAAPRVSKFGVGHLLNTGGEGEEDRSARRHQQHQQQQQGEAAASKSGLPPSASGAGGRAPSVTNSTSGGGGASGRRGSMSGPASARPAAALAPFVYFEYTVTVGKKPSAAQYYLDDTQQTEDALRALAKASLRPRGALVARAQAAAAAAALPPAPPSASAGGGSAPGGAYGGYAHPAGGYGAPSYGGGVPAGSMNALALLGGGGGGTSGGMAGLSRGAAAGLRVEVGPGNYYPGAAASMPALSSAPGSGGSGGGAGLPRPGVANAVRQVPGMARTAPQARAGVPSALANLYASTTGLSSLLALSTLVNAPATAGGGMPGGGGGGWLGGGGGGKRSSGGGLHGSAGSGIGAASSVESLDDDAAGGNSSGGHAGGAPGAGGAGSSPRRRHHRGPGPSSGGGGAGGSNDWLHAGGGGDGALHEGADEDHLDDDDGDGDHHHHDEDGDGGMMMDSGDEEHSSPQRGPQGSPSHHHHHHHHHGGRASRGSAILSPGHRAAALSPGQGVGGEAAVSADELHMLQGSIGERSPPAQGAGGSPPSRTGPPHRRGGGRGPVPSPPDAFPGAGSSLFHGYAGSTLAFTSTNVPLMSSAQLAGLAGPQQQYHQQQYQQQYQYQGQGQRGAPATAGPMPPGRFFPGGGHAPAGSITFSLSVPALTALVPAAPALGPPPAAGVSHFPRPAAPAGSSASASPPIPGGGYSFVPMGIPLAQQALPVPAMGPTVAPSLGPASVTVMPLLPGALQAPAHTPSGGAGGLQDYLRAIAEEEVDDVMF